MACQGDKIVLKCTKREAALFFRPASKDATDTGAQSIYLAYKHVGDDIACGTGDDRGGRWI